ncbi:hypothetical protein [Paenibacillus sp. GP183]|uniref:hypothetical protein n=1 Tax=Paenibacillus sp. GP183 TaxID=1882751 RepID=UPI0034507A80
MGLGQVAQLIHIPILDSLPNQYEIAALCSSSPKLLKVLGKKYRVTNLYQNSNKLVARPDLDAVIF